MGERPCRAGCSGTPGIVRQRGPAKPRQDMCIDEAPYELLWSCDSNVPLKNHAHSTAQEVLRLASTEICANKQLVDQMEIYLDCEYVDNYLRLSDEGSGWFEEAYVTY